MSAAYRIKEFANMAGVTPRTLQYYDRMGLLKPSGYTKKNHRMYEVDDLLRLQQVLTFKYLGYGLVEIRRLMQSPQYDLKAALRAQRKAIADRIAQLEKVERSLDRISDALESLKAETLDWDLVRGVIAGVVVSERWNWLQDYYTPEQQKILKARARKVTPQQMMKWQRQWSEVLLGFQQLMERKRKPGDAEAQRLAQTAVGLVQAFSGGNKGIEASLGRAYGDLEKMPKENRPYSVELQRFMNEACAIFRRGKSDAEDNHSVQPRKR
jgi:DNA-binding transcriptional MerR regulator